jgi:predicted CopG family antitoxin
MAYKTLGVRVSTYVRLKNAKLEGESFSALFERMLDRQERSGNIHSIIGSISKDDGEELKRIVKKNREQRRFSRI